MRTFLFVTTIVFMSVAIFVNFAKIHLDAMRRNSLASGFLALGINAFFVTTVIYLYNSSSGD